MTLHISRRTVLRGLGASLALPLLDAMAQANAALTTEPPRRMAFLFVPNGIHMPDWTPTTSGYAFELPYVLQPLDRVRDDVLILTGLTQDKGRANGDGPGDHARSASVFLTGAQPRKTSGSDIRVGLSVDQAAAQLIGQRTKFPSLELGCEAGRGAGSCDSGYSCAYSSNISWAGESLPMGKETNPRLVFQRLFGEGRPAQAGSPQEQRQVLRRSLLDFVAEDTRRLHDQLGAGDRRKLDEYLNGVREIERRMDRASSSESDWEQPHEYPLPAGIPANYAEHLRLMCDMIVLAFQADLTRIATFMLANAGSNRSYRPIDVPDGHHDLSHHGGDPQKHAKIREINRFHMRHFAYLLERLKAVPEGAGTLLDQCMIVYGSGLSDGNRHNHDNLPILLAGRGGGTINPGRHLIYEQETPLNNLFISMLDRVGASQPFLGDSTGPLPGLDY
jgi:hypothetical protein